jgi:signal transduction histidine kinase
VAEFDGIGVRPPAGALPRVEGDPRLIRQTLAPLIDNARRHARSAVTVELAGAGSRVVVTVRDDGPGVDPALGADVFLPGVRGVDASEGGAGLGLPLALRLARSCGAELTLGDGPGGCFVLSLPAVEPAAGRS